MTRVPGAALMTPAALAGLALVVVNDVVLKRHAPGVLSGKLSDVGLCLLLPLFVHAAMAWMLALGRLRMSARAHALAACTIATAYFVAVKCWPAATEAHVAWLSWLVRGARFRAVTDPTDLVALPCVLVALRAMTGLDAPSDALHGPSRAR